MKKRILLLPLLLFGTSAYAVNASDLYRIYCYTDPVVTDEPLKVHFSYTCLNNAKVTEVSRLYIRLFAASSDGSLTEWDAYTQENDPSFPSSFKKGSSYSFTHEFDIHGWPRNKRMEIHQSMFFAYDRYHGGSLAMTEQCSSLPGLPFYKEDSPLIIRHDDTYAPGRTSYDLGAAFSPSKRTATTYRYAFKNINASKGQVLNAFRVKITRTCVETGVSSLPIIYDAYLKIYNHAKEFAEIADQELSSSSVSVFPLTPFSYQGATSFELGEGYLVDRRTGKMSKGSPDVKRARTYAITMPIGTNERSSYYPSTLSFYMDGDYVEIPLTDINPHDGVSGNYEVVLWGKEGSSWQ